MAEAGFELGTVQSQDDRSTILLRLLICMLVTKIKVLFMDENVGLCLYMVNPSLGDLYVKSVQFGALVFYNLAIQRKET